MKWVDILLLITQLLLHRYVAMLSIPYIMKHVCPVQFLNRAMSLLSNVVSIMYFHKVT